MRVRIVGSLFVAGAAAAVGAASAVAVGPTPGFAEGVVSPDGKVRYVAVARSGKTIVRATRVRDGRTLRTRSLAGAYGVPLVAYDGTAGGVTRDGRRLVLETGGGDGSTRFVVLAAPSLRTTRSFTLRGLWAYDALSPGGKTLYLIQILSPAGTFRYLVRAFDLERNRLVRGAIADKSEPGAMTGYPLSRVASADGTWAYTLYQRSGASPFIHALNTRARAAVCIDLAWPGDPDRIGSVRLKLSADERRLAVRDEHGKTLLTVRVPRLPG